MAQGWHIVNAGKQPVNRGALPVDSWRARALSMSIAQQAYDDSTWTDIQLPAIIPLV